MNASFAQFRSEQRRAQLAESLAEREEEAEHFREMAKCSRGDIWAFVDDADGSKFDQLATLRDFAQQFSEGDVLRLSADSEDRGVLLARGYGANPRMVVVKGTGDMVRTGADQLDPAVAIVGQMVLPEPVRTRDGGYRKSVARLLRDWEQDVELRCDRAPERRSRRCRRLSGSGPPSQGGAPLSACGEGHPAAAQAAEALQ